MTTRLLRLGSVALALSGLTACNNPSTTDTDGGGGGTDTPTTPEVDGGHVGPGGEEFTLSFPTRTVDPGDENTQCVILRLGNENAIHVGEIENTLSEGSHHFIVYRTNATEERPDPFDCTPFLDTLDPANGSPLMITQRMSEVLTLPTGVAFPFDADQMIRLEMHYVNYGTEVADISATTTIRTIPDADFTDAADFLFIGTPDIDLPIHVTTTVGPVFFRMPAELAPASGPLRFFAITGHTHQLGQNVLVWTAADAADPGTAVYDESPWMWNEPTTRVHDPEFTVPAGGGFRFECEYNNTTDRNVGFGESTTDEMCFFWAYYYPSVGGGRVCVHTDQAGGPSGTDLCCPGSALCGLIGSI